MFRNHGKHGIFSFPIRSSATNLKTILNQRANFKSKLRSREISNLKNGANGSVNALQVIKMRIITVNLPKSYLKAIDALTGKKGLYPSRSELIRVAVRDFLIHELDAAKSFQKFQQSQISLTKQPQTIDENLFVRVPVNEASLGGISEYKTYKLVKR